MALNLARYFLRRFPFLYRGLLIGSPSFFLPTSNLHVELSPFLIPVAVSNLTTLPTWTGAVNAGARSQLIDVPIVFPAFFRSHMTDVDCSVIIVHVDLRDEFWKGINE